MFWMLPLLGAGAGAMLDEEDPMRGAMLGAGVGATGGLLGGAGAAAGGAGAMGAGAGEAAALGAAEGGLLAGGEQAAMLAAQNAGLEGALGATNAALGSNAQAAMLAQQNAGLVGATESTNSAANPAMGQKPFHATQWMRQKPFGEGGPSRGKLVQTGGKMMSQPQQQQQSAPPPRPIMGGQFVPSMQSSPYGQPMTYEEMMRRRYF